ncbi:Vacuolar protein sorting-associated protein 18 like protein [Dermatophagoides pteronyssinus]|uniref:Vacuolar protein sorting-associated protein 18 homolog n=1 Tax=Dermatophagoides pteronyssinus TaxID=6956 RepID=A0ABQ8IR39_DERPT|nr:Vacuolar protein sorting-associated protein 18 like protein [Dermatophagoides pteronyssinus]
MASILDQYGGGKQTGGIINLRSDQMEPIFMKNKIDFRPNYPITNMVVSNNQLLLSMENFHLLKIDLMNPNKPIELDLNPYLVSIKSPNRPVILGIFIDPTGQHCLITVGQRLKHDLPFNDNPIIPFENFYYYRKLSQLNKMKGHIITAVGWIDQQQPTGQCGNLLIGTNEGKLYETHLQSDDRFLQSRELSFWKFICDLSPQSSTTNHQNPDSLSSSSASNSYDPNKSTTAAANISSSNHQIPTTTIKHEPICSIRIFRLKNTFDLEYCILIATRNFIYQYIGRLSSSIQVAGGSGNSGGGGQTSNIDFVAGNNNNPAGQSTIIDGQPYLYQIIQSTTINNQKTFKEMPGYIPVTKLDLYQPSLSSSSISTNQDQSNRNSNYPLSFGWLTEPGIFYGEIPENLAYNNNERKIFDNAQVILYSDLNPSMSSSKTSKDTSSAATNRHRSIPKSLILTRFHLMLLYSQKLQVYCLLNRELIWEDRFIGGEIVEDLIKDPQRNTIWLYTKNSVYRYRIDREDRNIWEIYLQRKDFDLAKRYARNDLIKMDRIVCEEALYNFANKNYKKSAQLFTETQAISFEEITLKFIELRNNNNDNNDQQQDALKEFLLNKLKKLSVEKQQTQIIILLLWLFELMLNQLARLKSSLSSIIIGDDDGDDKLKNKQHQQQQQQQEIENGLKQLISNPNYRKSLQNNRKIFYNIILNHDNQQIYEYFAEKIGDFDCLLEHYYRQNDYQQMLGLMRREECLEFYYKYSPILIQNLPKELIDCLIPLASELDMTRLIPSLVHFDHFTDDDSNDSGKNNQEERREHQCKEILRFLEFCVYDLNIRDEIVHNYFLTLMIQYKPDKLLLYLNNIQQQQQTGGAGDLFGSNATDNQSSTTWKFPFDPIQLLSTMGAYEEAIEQALHVNDVQLAKQMANQVQQQSIINDHHSNYHHHHSNQDLAKRLWLKIAKHVIKNIYSDDHHGQDDQDGQEAKTTKNFDITMATSILSECSLLKIEDILPYFPEYLTIDHFKSAICQSLENYNENIESLRDDMKLATESAEQIRDEIARLRNRFQIINSSDSCSICLFPAINEHFFSFPSCGHLFHYKCLLKEIVEYLDPDNRIRLEAILSEIKSIQNQLQTLMSPESSSITLTNRLEKLNENLEDLIGNECLLCGNLMIETIDKSFIDNDRDRDQIRGWN